MFGHSKDKEEVKKAKDRYMYIRKLLVEENDNNGLALLNNLIKSALRYVEVVIDFETTVNIMYKENGVNKETQKIVEDLDRSRRSAHNTLIDNLAIVNRYLAKNYDWETNGGEIPIGGIYSLDPVTISDRKKVGDWSKYIITALYNIKK